MTDNFTGRIVIFYLFPAILKMRKLVGAHIKKVIYN